MDIQPTCVQGKAAFKLEISQMDTTCMHGSHGRCKTKDKHTVLKLIGPRRRTVAHVNCFDTSGSTTVADAVATQATICDLEPE